MTKLSMSLVLTCLLTFFIALSQARIVGVAVPETVKPGEGFNVVIMVENYIQSVYDVAIAFGLKPAGMSPDILGTVLGSYYLGPGQSNQVHNFTKWVEIPSDHPKGEATIAASLHSLYGAGRLPTLSLYNVDVEVGDHTSTNYVSSLNN